ncbi:MAG: CHASE2 domain-containing protein [Phormidesmis sp.]
MSLKLSQLTHRIKRFKRGLSITAASWRSLVIPGVLIIGFLCLLRFSGTLQTQEWEALDTLSRHCQSPSTTQQVVIVGIDEDDYKNLGGFPISDQTMAQAIRNLAAYQPRAIGLDIFRDMPAGKGQALLNQAIRTTPNLIAIEVALNEADALNTPPPPGIAAEQVGFADAIVDEDGKLRRVPLVARDWDGNLKYSLSLRLAQVFLKADGIELQPSNRSSDPLVFTQANTAIATLPTFRPHTGGYVRADANGNQMLLNFCRLAQPYERVALKDVVENTVSPDLIKDRVVIIGTIANSVKDSFITGAVKQTLYSSQVVGQPTQNQLIYGVEVHANAVQQIIDSVQNRAMALDALPEMIEVLFIVFGGITGIVISVVLKSPWKSILTLSAVLLLWIGISYSALHISLWLPILPVGLALCGAGLATAFFDRDARFELEQRRKAVDLTYGAVHNGPLQQLAAILRSLDESQPTAAAPLREQLKTLNAEMRRIFEHMRQSAADNDHKLYLADNSILDLQQPMPYLLYQVYEQTLRQSMPGFSSLLNCIPPNFECLGQGQFRIDQKRGLCLFLQEALLNVGKHAIEATFLEVDCYIEDQCFWLKILDNGMSPVKTPMRMREGTRQAMTLARSLRGTFRRYPKDETGVICELIWPIR